MPVFKTPFSRAYWREALRSFRSVRGMVFAALMVAACIALSYLPSIPVTPGGRTISLTFIPRVLCSLAYGPLGGLAFGVVEDTLSFLLNSRGYPYFPGYALTTMLGCFTYALFLYRTKVTVAKIFLAKLLTNVQNVFLGSLWSAVLYSKGYLYYMVDSAVKNLITLPIYTVILVVVLQALLPALNKLGVIPDQLGEGGRMRLIRT
jgi:ECF transporter S component (folate family)